MSDLLAISLGPDERPADNPGACTSHYPRDLALMNYLLQDLRSLIRQATIGNRRLVAHERIEWTVHDLERRTIVCDPTGIVVPETVHVVGFFGDPKAAVDRRLLAEAEDRLLDELTNHPGLLAYNSMELIDQYWANLVVHAEPENRERWRGSAVHRQAVDQVAPLVYNSVRIHRGRLPGGVTGTETIRIEFTGYWDYGTRPPWHAQRSLPGGLQAGAFPSFDLSDPADSSGVVDGG